MIYEKDVPIAGMAAKISKSPVITSQATKSGVRRARETTGFRTHQEAMSDSGSMVTGSKESQDYLRSLLEKGDKPTQGLSED